MTDWQPAADALVRHSESCARKRPDDQFSAYPDPGSGAAPWTIGWGSTGPDVTPATVWTQARCDARLEHDLETVFGPAVDRLCAGVPTAWNEKAAMVDFAYNEGAHALAGSALLHFHRIGAKNSAANEFRKWIYASHHPMRGLETRRESERTLYLTGKLVLA